MRFEFATATRIIYGPDVLSESGLAARSMGRRALVVTGSTAERSSQLLVNLAAEKVEASLFQVAGEPTTSLISEGLQVARDSHCDLIIGIGGGSALDAGKAISALVTNSGEMLDYLEVIGRGKALSVKALPFIAIPTTAGTGTEVTRNAVIGSPEHQVKVSLRSPLMLPRLALVDPKLTYDLPIEVTASTGLDALTQLIEPFVSVKANPISEAIAREGIQKAARALPSLQRDLGDRSARDEMALASLLGGIAMANAALGAVHGFAGPVGGMFPVPHGVVCARLLPLVMEANLNALAQRMPGSPVLARYQEVAVMLTGNAEAQPTDGFHWVEDLVEKLNISNLGAYGIKREHIPELVKKSARASSMKGNPIQLTNNEMRAILEQAL
jgi:alcohol dehydrogenase class IV